MKKFAVIRFDYPEDSDVYESDFLDDAEMIYNEWKKNVREHNNILLVEVLKSE